MSFKWSWLVVTLVVIFALGVGGFAVWSVAWLVEHLTTQLRRRYRSPDRRFQDPEDFDSTQLRRRYRSPDRRFQDPEDFDSPSRGWVHPYIQEMRDNPTVYYHPDLYRPPSPAPSSPRPFNIGTPSNWPPPLPPGDSKKNRRPTSGSSDYARTWVSVSDHSITSHLTLETGASRDSLALEAPISHIPLGMNTESPSRRASQTIPCDHSRRGSWPLQTSLLRTQTVSGRNSSLEDTTASIRWPFLGRVRSDLFSASSLLSSESSYSPLWEDWTDKGPKAASELESKPPEICRYVAHPGPRAPLPCDWYDGHEVMASAMHLKPSSAKLSGLSPPMRD
ncbi:hypothetical protein GJ744_000157 [Endocarpon pusillum]|uniref:Uncharacterized protein n=1 Tax=Endocarpon pusillum TaxID=364733 RepID=A0A8H7AWW6_9EURO|nr:hypothetical protein GJ744_000157 [Endocarpon pusillum]